jgi:ubiquinone/menaquinone biosynthesis C-methylase UbiE
MKTQIELLDLTPGVQVLDLGSGTGELANTLRQQDVPISLHVVELDIVKEALRGSSTGPDLKSEVQVSKIAADLDVRGGALPLKSASADRLLASLLLSYLGSPHDFLVEILRVLRPGGVAVVSSLRRDADISKIYTTGIAELQADRVADLFGADVAARFETLQREFLNSASRLLDLEEGGRFRFFDEDELVALLEGAGFTGIASRLSFGEPPQAIVVSGRRP